MQVRETNWKYSGQLSQLHTSFDGGVYIFVLEGDRPCILYVGTAKQSTGFTRRWCQHLDLFATGGRTVWRPGPEADVYSLMSHSSDDYEGLALDNQVWIPSNTKTEGIYNPYYPKASGYSEFWRDWVLNTYLDKISVWRCELESVEELLILESQIQSVFQFEYNIKFYREVQWQSWLGKQEISDLDRLRSYRFKFTALPKLESDMSSLMSDLYLKI